MEVLLLTEVLTDHRKIGYMGKCGLLMSLDWPDAVVSRGTVMTVARTTLTLWTQLMPRRSLMPTSGQQLQSGCGRKTGVSHSLTVVTVRVVGQADRP
jgi:hypothetical protein